jgi:hypothetical protein
MWTDMCKKEGVNGRLLTGGMSPTGPGTRWSPVLRAPVASGIRYEGGNGASIDVAIIITGTKSKTQGEDAKLNRLIEWYGARGTEWELVEETKQHYRGREIDVVEIRLKNGRTRTIYFDVTAWHAQHTPVTDTPDAA